MRFVVAVVALASCRGNSEPVPAIQEAPAAAVQLATPLPAHFPLPASTTRKLVRSSARSGMAVWEYEYADLDATDAVKKIDDGMVVAGYASQQSLLGTKDGRTYAVAVHPHASGSTIAIRSFPEAGPPTLAAPPSYPTSFPFLAGGTASTADGPRLRIAYPSDPSDIETAVVLAATRAGWQCTGSGNVHCTRDKAVVLFTAEAAPTGSVLVVNAP